MKPKRFRFFLIYCIVMLLITQGLWNCGSGSSNSTGTGNTGGTPPPNLSSDPAWYADSNASPSRDNLKALNDFIDQVGINSTTYTATKKPVAIFDLDDTLIKNSLTDLVLFWMLNNNKVLQPPDKNWGLTTQFLNTDAKTTLSTACDSLADVGGPLPTATTPTCVDEFVAIYIDGNTTQNKTAFSSFYWDVMDPKLAWAAQLQAGYTAQEIKNFATEALNAGLASNENDTQQVGTRTVNAWLRIYTQMQDLLKVLQQNGFEVWIVSEASQPVAEAFAEKIGFPTDHVIGTRTVIDMSGKLTYNFQGCGDEADGKNDGMGSTTANHYMNYKEGKRCWINKVIYGDTSQEASKQNSDLTKRPAFGAGDSEGDVSFLNDTIGLKLVINRNKTELMCHAYHNDGGDWLINPMFIQPKNQLSGSYTCSTACVIINGPLQPCLDKNGNVLPDQSDTVFVP